MPRGQIPEPICDSGLGPDRPRALPFTKIPGGKRRTAPFVRALLPEPAAYDRYYEPFLGGGAVFFDLASEGLLEGVESCLSDQDTDLIALWQDVAEAPDALIRSTQVLFAKARRRNQAEFYLEQRAAWNAGRRSTARQLFLRRTAWNGLWRLNRKGHLNTPYRGELPHFDPEPVRLAHRLMAGLRGGVTLKATDYDSDVVSTPARSIIYADPPYVTEQRSGRGFTAYTAPAGVWAERELEALIVRCAAWAEAGAYVYFSHADTEPTRDLLRSRWPRSTHQMVMVPRAINADTTRRGAVAELLVHEPRTRARLV